MWTIESTGARAGYWRAILGAKGLRRLGATLLALSFPLVASAQGPVPGYEKRGDRWMLDDPFPANGRRATGLQHPFPEIRGLAQNPLTPQKVELGRMLFFDPIVSGDNSISCATCHHPDLGLADGRPLGMGVGGTGFGPERRGGRHLSRNTPSLWNVVFNEWQFWDGRARELEDQAPVPITNEDEMAEDPGRLVEELRAIPEYVLMFEDAFEAKGPAAVTFENAVAALTSFERTLITFNSKFDRYAAGDFSALDASEKNGLKLFRSLETRCFECHSFPTFSDGSFRVLGVPDEGEPDLGRGGAADRSTDRSFKVPTLRNVELTAPYMHNGSLATLEEVVTFYAEGGGRREANPAPMIDDKIQKFDLTPEETDDLVAFLKALTDTSLLPVAPERVPSGLTVLPVESLPGPAVPAPEPVLAAPAEPWRTGSVSPVIRLPPGADRTLEIIETEQGRDAQLAAETGDSLAGRPPLATFHVRPGQSIQAALDRAHPGDRIELAAGSYPQSVEVRTEGVTLAGPAESDPRAILEGGGVRAVGIRTFANGLRLESLTLRDYVEAGLMADERADMPEMVDLRIEAVAPRDSMDGRPSS